MENKSNQWHNPLNRTFFIAVAASSILAIGIWIGRAITNMNSNDNQDELSTVINYIKAQDNIIDSLTKLNDENIYKSLDGYNEELKVGCQVEETNIKVYVTTSVFNFLGEGIYEYQAVIEKLIGSDYTMVFVTPKQFYEHKANGIVTINYIIPNVLEANQKYRLAFRLGEDKKLYGNFICP